ncbi:MAG: threonine synthase, partial [Flavobacteriaceae bacterium]
MKYFSLNHNSIPTDFPTAVRSGLAPDRGLYFPESIPKLDPKWMEKLSDHRIEDICFRAIHPFLGDSIPEKKLYEIISETLNFEFPVTPITEQIGPLELFHGPTLAFKDVGARFMARCLGYFNHQNQEQKVTVLVATSGDTGGAVADGFLGVEGIDVVILYPKGKVSAIQEKQLTALGQNITALEVDGVFDDCQDMVKTAFLDDQIKEVRPLTSANSINVARWLPQMFYYFIAVRQLQQRSEKLVFSVPSGNFGNICAGMMAQQMGLPIDHFIAANNRNDAVVEYLNNGVYEPKKTIPTISNAMDVGAPSNFIRIQKIVNNDLTRLRKSLSGYSYTDSETKKGLKYLFDEHQYIADPHGAVGYLGLEAF